MATTTTSHPQRREIARYLLSRGTEATAGTTGTRAAHESPLRAPLAFPNGLAPVPDPDPPARSPSDPLPRADVVVITWTVDEVAALAGVLTPGISPRVSRSGNSPGRWFAYARNFDRFAPQIASGAPAHLAGRLGSFYPLTIGTQRVLAMKSELHLNQDGKLIDGDVPTLPVKDFFKQVVAEARPKVVLTVGTAGSVFDGFGLGDVVVTRGAKFLCTSEFAKAPFNNKTFTSDWTIPTEHLATAQRLMAAGAADLAEPPVGPPSPEYPEQAELLAPEPTVPEIKLDDGKDMPEFHPILTTDFFEYGTTLNRLDKQGAAVEMGDAALGLAASELDDPPHWAVVRNMSDPVINGKLPAKEFHLNEQTTWAVAFYTAYGVFTSINSALVTWAIIAGL